MNGNCYETYQAGLTLPGAYYISALNKSVYCLSNGWTSVQHRGQYGNPIDYFQKNWNDYVEGFGNFGM